MTGVDKTSSVLRDIPRGIWALGFVSMFMDISSETIHALLPVYLVSVLGTSTFTVGVIEGVAEATALISRIFSGVVSDWFGRRKLLAAVGYGLAALVKPIFPLATAVGWLAAARFLDRLGKGIRGAPRDALIADIAPPQLRGASFGLRQSLDTVGAVAGPSAAIVLMALTGDDFRAVYWIAVIPALLAFGLIVFAVKEPARNPQDVPRAPIRLVDAKRLSAAFWAVVAVWLVLSLARLSEAFLILRAEEVGLRIALVPLVLVIMNVAYALSAYPAGVLSDRFGRGRLLVLGIALLVVADAVLALDASVGVVMFGVVLWGLHMGFTQGLVATLVADAAPVDLRGTAFGALNLVGGLAMLAASLLAGALWDYYGPAATFIAGGVIAAGALAGLGLFRNFFKRPSPETA